MLTENLNISNSQCLHQSETIEPQIKEGCQPVLSLTILKRLPEQLTPFASSTRPLGQEHMVTIEMSVLQ